MTKKYDIIETQSRERNHPKSQSKNSCVRYGKLLVPLFKDFFSPYCTEIERDGEKTSVAIIAEIKKTTKSFSICFT